MNVKANIQCNIIRTLCFSCFSLLPFLLVVTPAHAQKYNFINFNVENGLSQSQVTAFSQDKNNELLIGTFGGLSIFDGTDFVNYSKANGLSQNRVQTIACDNQNIWIGTNNGISRFDGKHFKTFKPVTKSGDNAVQAILKDAEHNIWALINNNLFRFNGKDFVQQRLQDTVRCITLDNTGKLWMFAFHKGIYVYKAGRWHLEIDVKKDPALDIFKMRFGAYSGTLFTIGNRFIQIADNGVLRSPDWLKSLPVQNFVLDLIEDSKGNIWLAEIDGGAWLFTQKDWIHYTYQNGLTDDNINAFYEDGEGNIWIGSNGSGIFRYTGSIFTYYDRSSGLAAPSVMSIAQTKKGNVFLASSSDGLYQLANGRPQKIDLPVYTNRISTIVIDTTNTLWIGTEQSGIWKYNSNGIHFFRPSLTQNAFSITNLYRCGNTIWVASSGGLFKLQNDSLVKANIGKSLVYAAISIGNDSLLVGTLKGAYIYRTDISKLIPQPFVENSSTLCFATDAANVYIGTDDKGVLIWNRRTKAFTNISHQSGLTCDYVYSLLRDRNGNLWVGTGCGIDKITFTDKSYRIQSFGKSDGLLGVENNANASFEDREGYLWFGTTKGVFRYNPYVSTAKQQAPRVLLQNVKLFSKEIPAGKYADSTTPFNNLEWDPVLPPAQNHLTFTFKGIYLSNPEKIKYRYQLAGIDKVFTETDQNTVVYPNLPPGRYLFKVWASDADGNWYNNGVTYPFTIKAPYYTTWYFRLGGALLLIGMFLGGVYYRNRQKEYRRRWQEKLREEQQAIVRQKTAEDFHDEIGNKLTRINLLTTIAESKLHKPPEELKKILHQIQHNVNSLYRGSKDIIWSLQPDSDFLNEIIFRIRQNTEELLEGSDIDFEYKETEDFDKHIKMPVDYSRNMIMIFKEAVNNAVKHAGCTMITLSVQLKEQHVLFRLKDNGIGLHASSISNGNGFGNMKNRAKRIGAELRWESETGNGTEISLLAPIK
jgi:signal transduction histidine kinase/ligand-binding sensor domain-containing protein